MLILTSKLNSGYQFTVESDLQAIILDNKKLWCILIITQIYTFVLVIILA